MNGVERFLDRRPDILTVSPSGTQTGLGETPPLFVEAPPDLFINSNPLSQAATRLMRKFDPAERDARNRALGARGEELVFQAEKSNLAAGGREDLGRKVRWVSREDGDGAGYDILSFDRAGNEKLLEVKTTIGGQRTPFFLSENERSLSVERPGAFRLMRLYDFNASPKAFMLKPPLENSILLRPANYRASFDG